MNIIIKTCGKIFLRHLISIFLSLILLAFLGGMLFSGREILYSVITTVIYLMLLYTVSWDMGHYDKFGQTGVKANLLRINLSCLPVIIIGAAATAAELINPEAPLSFFRIWYAPFANFISKPAALIQCILSILSTPVWCMISYAMGMRDFSLIDKYAKWKNNRDKNKQNELARKKEERRQMRRNMK